MKDIEAYGHHQITITGRWWPSQQQEVVIYQNWPCGRHDGRHQLLPVICHPNTVAEEMSGRLQLPRAGPTVGPLHNSKSGQPPPQGKDVVEELKEDFGLLWLKARLPQPLPHKWTWKLWPLEDCFWWGSCIREDTVDGGCPGRQKS